MYKLTILPLITFFLFISSESFISVDKTGQKKISKPAGEYIDFVSDLRYGLFSHYVWGGGGGTVDQFGVPSKTIHEQINTFDVRQYIEDIKNFGVQYVIFTAWHFRMNPLYFSPVYRKWRENGELNNPDENDRDLIAELAAALKAEGIDLFLYTHPNDLHDFTPADQAKFDYKYKGDTTFNFNKWNLYLNEMYSEIAKRYKGQIKGFWQYKLAANRNDGSTWPSFKYSTLAYVVENVISKENPAVLLKAQDIFRYTIYQSASNSEGLGACWVADPKRGLNSGDIWVKGVKKTLSDAGQLIKPISISFFATKPSTSWPARVDVDPDSPFEKTGDLGDVTYVAMQSKDGGVEYIHVLNSFGSDVHGKTLTLIAPADGKVFTGARLVKDNTTLRFKKSKDGIIRITLPRGVEWDINDTAIALISLTRKNE